MSSIRTTLHHYLSSQLFIRTIHLSPNTVGFQPLIWSPDNQFSYQPGQLIFRPAPPAAKYTEQTPIQSRRGSTITDFPPVNDDVEQFPAREEEEATETEISRDEQPVVPSSGSEDPLRYEDPIMQISGTGHWFLEG